MSDTVKEKMLQEECGNIEDVGEDNIDLVHVISRKIDHLRRLAKVECEITRIQKEQQYEKTKKVDD